MLFVLLLGSKQTAHMIVFIQSGSGGAFIGVKKRMPRWW